MSDRSEKWLQPVDAIRIVRRASGDHPPLRSMFGVIEITTRAPATSGNASGWQRRVQFSHANGQADVKSVTKF